MRDICLICNNRSDNFFMPQLQKIKFFLQINNIKPTEVRGQRFNWFITLHCRYGIYCSTLQQSEIEARNLAERLEPYIITVAKGKDSSLYHQLLELLQGYFPAIYSEVEKIHVNGNSFCR